MIPPSSLVFFSLHGRMACLVSHCAQLSHPLTHWQIFFPRPTLRLLRNRFPVTCHWPGREPSDSLCLYLGEWPRLPFTARIERAQFHRARSASKKGTWPLPVPSKLVWFSFREFTHAVKGNTGMCDGKV